MRVTPLEPSAPSSPAHSPRRAFVARLAGVIATWPFVSSRLGAIVASRFGILPASERVPNASLLDALGDAVLPAELGPSGVTRAVGAFQQWMDQYRPGAEANHGYGTGRIESVPADPRPHWRDQLAALDSAARRDGVSFGSLSRERRQAVVRTALAGERGESLPSPLAARHVAVALLAHFYDSPAATDLCYEAEIGRQQCRPLAAQTQKPVVLERRGR
jgi:hypothetical protein